jgi:hypothetical protein
MTNRECPQPAYTVTAIRAGSTVERTCYTLEGAFLAGEFFEALGYTVGITF